MTQQHHKLRHDAESMLEAIRRAQSRFIIDSDPKNSFDEILNIVLSITESEYGFIGEIFHKTDTVPYLKTHAITQSAWSEEFKFTYEDSIIEGLELYNPKTLFGSVITTGKPIIANDPPSDPRFGGLPDGHPTIRSFMGLPFHLNGKMIGMIGVANHPVGYTQDLIDWLAPILDTCSTLTVGYQNFRARKQFEKELRESEAHLRLSQIGGGIGTWEADLVNGKQTWSDSCVSLLGFPCMNNPGWEDFLKLVHPEDQQKVIDATRSHIEQGTKYEVEYRAIGKSEETLWIRSAGQVEFSADGKPIIMRGIAQDITARKLIEIKARDTQLQLQATMAAIPDLLFEIDFQGRYHDCHYLSADLLAAPKEEFLGKTVHEVLPPPAVEIVMSALQEANQNGRSQGKQIELDVPQGKLWFELSVSRKHTTDHDIPHFIVLSRDITERKSAEEEIHNLAFQDALTNLPNRRLLMNRLQHALDSSARSGRRGALLFIDMDNFKTLNDSLGHDIGDLLLQQVANRLESCVRQGDTVARLGGDEFLVILEFLSTDSSQAVGQTEIIGGKILKLLNQYYQLNAHEYRGSGSIGATLFAGHQTSVEELMKQADIAMYQSKKAGRNTLRFFDAQMQRVVNAHAALEGELHKALENQQFHLYYQVQVDSSRRPFGAEALIRWAHPERGLVLPAEFIPLAEETGQILPIGRWVLDSACAQIKLWEQDPLTRNLILAVNVSARQFRQPGFSAQVQANVKHHDINPTRLKLELTEGLLVDNIEDTIETMNALSKIGVGISLDDFGTGYSSLQYLKLLPINQLKIDQSFIRDISTDSSDKAIVRTIIAMAQSMKLNVIAEGVETEAQRQILLEEDCTYYQGHLFSKPLPIEQFNQLLKQSA